MARTVREICLSLVNHRRNEWAIRADNSFKCDYKISIIGPTNWLVQSPAPIAIECMRVLLSRWIHAGSPFSRMAPKLKLEIPSEWHKHYSVKRTASCYFTSHVTDSNSFTVDHITIGQFRISGGPALVNNMQFQGNLKLTKTTARLKVQHLPARCISHLQNDALNLPINFSNSLNVSNLISWCLSR